MDNEGTKINLEKVGSGIKSILVIGGIIWAIAGFYFTSQFGQEAFAEEQATRAKTDEALYERITKTTQRNSDWNKLQDQEDREIWKELIKLKVKSAIEEEREKFVFYRIEQLEKSNADD
jgi:predicted site-specific integrase-resolvase